MIKKTTKKVIKKTTKKVIKKTTKKVIKKTTKKVIKKKIAPKPIKKIVKKRIVKKIVIPKQAKIKKIIVPQLFNAGENIVYPTHGVGRILTVEKFQYELVEEQLYVIQFFQDKLTIRVPFIKVKEIGLRGITSKIVMSKTLKNLSQKPKIKKAMWSRRAQEYDQKINSGDIKLLSEVVRDLFRKDDQTEQSYSERQMFQVAFERYTRELAISSSIKFEEASARVLEILNKR
ncbi:CarD family transcriptional regulator [Alphaproteobacteria bacterium]|nr:CarD family transcriptional regulator [Alphaproteobacteria bacterium]